LNKSVNFGRKSIAQGFGLSTDTKLRAKPSKTLAGESIKIATRESSPNMPNDVV
jgi:hypothetical protein